MFKNTRRNEGIIVTLFLAILKYLKIQYNERVAWQIEIKCF